MRDGRAPGLARRSPSCEAQRCTLANEGSFYSFEDSLGWFSCFLDTITGDIITVKGCKVTSCTCCQFGRNRPSGITETNRDTCPIEGAISKAQRDYKEVDKSFNIELLQTSRSPLWWVPWGAMAAREEPLYDR